MFINLAHTIKTFLLMGFAFLLVSCGLFPSGDSTSTESGSASTNSPSSNDAGDTGDTDTSDTDTSDTGTSDTDTGDSGTTTVTNPLGVVGPKNYTQLVWYDEFDEGSAPNSTKWTYDLGSPEFPPGSGNVWGNYEQEHYTSDADNSFIADGKLVIQPIYETPEGASTGVIASSARVISKTDNYWSAIGDYPYGFYEIRAKIPCLIGSWPAIWLLGKNGNWPDQGELDIMEWFGAHSDQFHVKSAVHTRKYHGGDVFSAPSSNPQVAESVYIENLCSEYQRFQLEWFEEKVILGVNDTPTLTFSKESNSTNDQWPFHQPAYILLNVAIGGQGGSPNPSEIKDMTMWIDYVRVWKDPDGAATSNETTSGLITNGDFEQGTFLWEGNAAQVENVDGSNVNSSFNDRSDNPWDVNLFQKLAITEGATYQLSFRAKSDRTRTMIAGIGLNEEPYTNVSQLVNLSISWQKFNLELAASNFGRTNSRVFFDMGDDTGWIYLDDVVLELK